ncbi:MULTISPECIES: Gfo/Idh/MocA family oxidoreductase [unclassified Pantoea]|uniref:Gfo/Idh/MocA family protein n=1 Tax=unclassified Pantoea TaxID=2630326 RepID=UPI0024777E4D|nr:MULTISPECIES: Gfo/Idh/MocA family oxidoreductase [unclassified Pantoea]GME29879.1 Gfo/Idh/MocA family oxidoreductase [Pantoea sp. QMID3]GME30170.1 Gfo/Idh/MocA family oxidoreductase [Pantoea sp. QMID1]GME49841.1 Gfo/Idh/MocA family oxidoreductase [Pantoea sp. QMID4]GME51053.1 Gfo/Idh/MocA family oxidoreductase [Pantoea sp. QMID2]
MLNGEKVIPRPLRWAMIGGGRLSQVGYKHRSGALRDNTAYQLVASAFDIDAARGREFGINLGLSAERCYDNYQQLLTEEAKRDDGIEVVTIATPNGTHFEITLAALNAGIHVICEKPLFFTSAEAREIKALAAEKGLIVGVTYGFSGHPLLMQMRAMIAKGEIGDVRMVELQYTHGFSANDNADKFSDAQKWRVDPKIAGPSFVLGDISTHTFYISQLVLPDLKIKSLLCDRQSFIPSRAPLEDNAMVLMHYENGAVGRMWASAINAGSMDSQSIRVIGSGASLEWSDYNPGELKFEVQGQPNQILHHGMPYLDESALADERLGALHTEGLAESWANIYLKFARAIIATQNGDRRTLETLVYPDINAGAEGVRWIENCVRSADNGASWVDYQ